MTNLLDTYFRKHANLEGWFLKENALVWDFLLSFQGRSGVDGGVMEIGIWGGKSAALLAMHALPQETAVFADVAVREAARQAIMAEHPRNTIIYEGRSSRIHRPEDLGDVDRNFRFIHIDGGHTGTEVTHDLKLADAMLGERGLICVDDFFSAQYPQITDAVLRYVAQNPYSLSMILVGFDKAYFVRPLAARDYMAAMDGGLLKALNSAGCEDVNLCKTTYPNELNCFGLQWAEQGRGGRLGPDFDRENLNF